MRIAVIGAHPDDQELGMGGTIARLASQGHEVTLIDLTDGEPTPKGSVERRCEEATSAARILGAKRLQVGLTNREIADDAASRDLVARTIRETRPEILFAPHPEDAHPDHIAASRLVDAARFAAKYVHSAIPGEPWHAPKLFHYYSIHLKSIPQPSFLADTTGFASRKREAILVYRSQFVDHEPNRQIPEWIDAQGIYFGSRIGTESAEAFFSRECFAFDFAAQF